MTLAKALMAAAIKSVPAPLYADDLFAACPYIGNGSSQVITNNLDLAGKGGMLFVFPRDYTSVDPIAFDTLRGVSKFNYWNGTSATTTNASLGITAFSASGFTAADNSAGSYGVNGAPGGGFSGAGGGYGSVAFCKSPKFFDIVTWVGNGAASRPISHALGVAPGMIIAKCSTAAGSHHTYHRQEVSGSFAWVLNGSAAVASTNVWASTAPGSSTFTVDGVLNTSGQTYIAYVFAHDASASGIIQCDVLSVSGGVGTANLGWEPQFLMMHSYGNADTWHFYDTARGLGVGDAREIRVTGTGVEASNPQGVIQLTPAGFTVSGFSSSNSQVFLAVRRTSKPITTPSELFNAVNYTGNDTTNQVTISGMKAVDTALFYGRSQATGIKLVSRAWTAGKYLGTSVQTSETTAAAGGPYLDLPGKLRFTGSSDAMNVAANDPGVWCFRRAPGFHDVVHDTGTGAAHTIAHALGVAPELIIRRGRSVASDWIIQAGAPADYLVLNTTAAKTTLSTMWNSTAPTASVFSVGTNTATNTNTTTYTTLLFASLAGVSKVGTYTGNGTSQTINCGFAAGARFILIKRTDAAGEWFVWDTTNGIVAGDDPHFSLQATAFPVTNDDSVDPAASGFIVNQVAATNVNVSTATYLYLAIA